MSFKNKVKRTGKNLMYALAVAGLIGNPGCSTYTNRIPTNPKPSVQSNYPITETSSLEKLAKDGLPQELQDLGFRMGDYVNKGSDQEIVIIEEYHDSSGLRKKQGKLLKYLASKHAIDSIGLECATGVSPELKTIGKKGKEKLRDILTKYHEQGVDLPFYGIEDERLLETLYETGKKETEELKGKSLDEQTKIIYRNLTKNLPLNLEARNKSFARNIKDHFRTGSKRSAIVIGTAHAQFPFPEFKNFQEYLPYSYLVIYSPDIDKNFMKKEVKFMARYNGMTLDQYRQEIKRVLNN